MTNKSVTGSLDREGREALNAVFDALSAWREEVAASTARYSQTVLDKMAAAATAMGRPKEVVETSRKHFEQASKMQTNMIDQLMDAWQEQLKSPMPGPFNVQLRRFPGMGLGASQNSTFQIAPVQLWMEAAEAWQRNWASAWSMWTGQAAGMMGAGGRAVTPAR
jgi:predicted O-linked N-acetylglucosamine transferase (SPINDLY family)